MQIRKGNEISADPHRAIMMVGRQKSGKSYAAASFSKAGPLFCYDLDLRIRSVLHLYPEIEYVQPKAGAGFNELDEFIETQLKNDRIKRLPYETLWYASLSSTEIALLTDAIKLLGQSRARNGDYKGYQIGNIKMTDVQHYGYVSIASMQLWENGLSQLAQGRYFLYEAHICTKFDDKGDSVGRMILTTDKNSERLPGRFDEVYEFIKEPSSIAGGKPKYYVCFENDIASTAFPSLKTDKTRKIDITDKCFYDEWRRLIEPDLKGAKE